LHQTVAQRKLLRERCEIGPAAAVLGKQMRERQVAMRSRAANHLSSAREGSPSGSRNAIVSEIDVLKSVRARL